MFKLFKKKAEKQNFSSSDTKNVYNDRTLSTVDLESLLTLAVALKLKNPVELANFHVTERVGEFLSAISEFLPDVEISDNITKVGTVNFDYEAKNTLNVNMPACDLVELVVVFAFLLNKNTNLVLKTQTVFDESRLNDFLSIAKKCGYKVKLRKCRVNTEKALYETEFEVVSSKCQLAKFDLKYDSFEQKVFLLLCAMDMENKVAISDALSENNLLERVMCMLEVPIMVLELELGAGVRKIDIEGFSMHKRPIFVDMNSEKSKYIIKN